MLLYLIEKLYKTLSIRYLNILNCIHTGIRVVVMDII